jgi:hypothetical protein
VTGRSARNLLLAVLAYMRLSTRAVVATHIINWLIWANNLFQACWLQLYIMVYIDIGSYPEFSFYRASIREMKYSIQTRCTCTWPPVGLRDILQYTPWRSPPCLYIFLQAADLPFIHYSIHLAHRNKFTGLSVHCCHPLQTLRPSPRRLDSSWPRGLSF